LSKNNYHKNNYFEKFFKKFLTSIDLGAYHELTESRLYCGYSYSDYSTIKDMVVKGYKGERMLPVSQPTSLIMLQIKNQYSEFNPAMRQIADYLFDSSDKALHMGISELASECQVSVASITRFVHHLNFKNFKAFQLGLAKSKTVEGSSEETIPVNNRITFEYGGTSPNDSVEDVGKKVFQSNIQMLSDTMRIIDYKKVEYVANLVAKAQNVVFFGAGLSYITAENGQRRFNRLGINSFAYSGNPEMIVAATTCTGKDVFFGISNFGRSATVVKNIQRAKSRGAVVIGITSADGSPLMRAVDICFLTAFNHANMEYRTHNQEFEPSSENIAQMVLLDCIYMNVALKPGKSYFDVFYNTARELSKECL
jgi:DNA-binding MurR/RpiR family transcriptional regulator